MKLKKHLKTLIEVFIKIMEDRESHRMYRGELVKQINNQQRVKINERQLSYVLKKQEQFDYEPKGRNEYEFKKRN